jgi:uncharacterized protein YegL
MENNERKNSTRNILLGIILATLLINISTITLVAANSFSDNPFNYDVPYLRQKNYPDCGASACGPTSIAMIIRYYYPHSNVTGYDIYHMGTQGYVYYANAKTGAPAKGYRNVGFAEYGEPPIPLPPDTWYQNVIEEFKKYYHDSFYSGMIAPAGVRALNHFRGDAKYTRGVSISRVIEEIKNRPLLLNVKEAAGFKSDGHWIVLRGYDDNGTPEDYNDDKFYINDPWTTTRVPNGENREITYAHLNRIFNKNIITYIPNPTQTEEQRKYTVLVDNGFIQDICPSPAGNFEADRDACDEHGDYIWLEYYNSAYGDWIYPTKSGQSVKWIPILSLNGSYEIHVLLFKDKDQGNVKYTIYDPDDIEIDNKTINQEGTDWSDEILGIFSLKKGSYVQVDDMPAKCNADAIRFEYILSLCIITPTQASPASAGDYENPHHIGVKVEVKEGTIPIMGLNDADFSFKIGEKSAVASLIDDTSIPGEYVFDVTPPKQGSTGRYDFEVKLTYQGSIFENKEKEAVVYTTENADVILVIDRSGSMKGQKIEDAKNSAKLFIDYMMSDDKAGVVSFASSAKYDYHLTTLTDAVKIAIKNAIDGIYASGGTSIRNGLRYAYNDLVDRGNPTHAWAMVLLSDGRGAYPYDVILDIKSKNIRVYSVGLGSDVDQDLMEHIASETGGKYYFSPTSSQLQDIYYSIVGEITGWGTIIKRGVTIFLHKIIKIPVWIDQTIKEAIFGISWGGSEVGLVLYKPDGSIIDPSEKVIATVRASTNLSMSLSIDRNQYCQGETAKTIVSLTENGSPLIGATVKANITLPDMSINAIILYDDGGHGDIAANDGVYANYFVNTLQTGDYNVVASATGMTSLGEQFSREDEASFKVVTGQSSINITPDTWSEAISPGGQVKTTFTVNDPAAIGKLFLIDEYLYAEYNGTHYIVYNESSIGGEPDYIIPTSPSGKALAASPVSKWVSLTATSLQTSTGDIIDVSNIVFSSDVLEVPLGGSKDFNATINVPHDAPGGIYSGKIVATAIGGSDSVDVAVTISNPPIANANGPYTGVIEYIAVPILFDGTGSYDPGGTIVKYAWDLDDDGVFDDALGATPIVSFTVPCLGNIHLKVTDNNGATDTDTTTLTITKHSAPPDGIHGGLLTPPEQPQCYSGTSTIQGKGYFTIDERIQDWATAIDTTEHIEGTGEIEMDTKTVLDQAANPLDFYDPNFYNKKTIQFQGNATNRLINREKFESSGIFGGTGTRVSEYFNVSAIQKDESSSIKTISAPGSGQSHSFATMDDFAGIWGIHSEWQKICQKEIAHRQLFAGNFSVQKDLTFEREVIMP